MSRSYRKTPIFKSHDGGKKMKRIASKTVRRNWEVPLKGGNYKKLFNSWDLNDYVIYWPIEDTILTYEENEYYRSRFETLEKFLIYWRKKYIRK